MIRRAMAALALVVGGTQALAADDSLVEAQVPLVAAQVIVRQQIIIRVPPRGAVPASANGVHWREGNGPRCLAARDIAAAMPSQNNVDFIMRDSSRVRARLGQRCAGLDYYRGFYVDARPDGRICAERDALRSRMGGACDISEFRTLQRARR